MPMPMADLFAPDVNYVSARSVYPTSSGGSLASAAGAMTMNTGVVAQDPQGGQPGPTVAAGSPIKTSGQSVFWWVGFLAFLLVMVWVARKAGGEEDFRNIRPTFYNFFAITLSAIVGIVGLKVVFTKYRIPGASDIVLAA